MERVDKRWQHDGLTGYPTEAILGTLGHYGITLDEAALRAELEASQPLDVAVRWDDRWKGTGQFSRFHWAAAEELTRRFFPDRLVPGDVARAMADLVQVEARVLAADGGDAKEAALKAREELWDRLDEQLTRLPTKDGSVDPAFEHELSQRLGEVMESFGRLAEALAKKGELEEARRVVALEVRLFPQWDGVSQALLQAAAGEPDRAIEALEAISLSTERSGPSRVAAADALMHLRGFAGVQKAAHVALEEAEAGGDLHLGLEMGERLAYILENEERTAELQRLVPRLEALAQRHHHEHGAHGCAH